jgi:hypothetical protein
MAQKTYIFTHDCKAPYVEITGKPHQPQEIKFLKFRRGDQVKGELKHANNKPAFILGPKNAIIPLDCVKELITKAVVGADSQTVSSFNGNSSDPSEPKKVLVPTNPKVRYMDAMLLGAAVGLVGVVIAEKQGWISEPDSKYKWYGAAAGAAAAAYIVYRTSNAKPKVQIVNNKDII